MAHTPEVFRTYAIPNLAIPFSFSPTVSWLVLTEMMNGGWHWAMGVCTLSLSKLKDGP